MDALPGFKFHEWHKECGPVLRIDVGVQRWILVSDHEIVQHLFVTNGAVASNRPFQLFSSQYYALGKRGIVLADPTKKWKHLRTVVLSVASPKMVAQFSSILQREADSLIKDLTSACTGNNNEDTDVNPLPLLQRTSLNYVLQTGFGLCVSEQDELFHEIITFIDEGLKLGGVQNDLAGFLPILKVVDVILGHASVYKRFIRERRDPLFTKLIQKAAEGDQDCVFKRLYEQKEQLGLEDADLLVAAGDFITGGTDTTAVTLEWIFAILLHHPDVCRKLSEVDSFTQEHKRFPIFTDRESFPYLISVQKECMRYRSLAHFSFFHVLEKDITYKGYLFPKGASVLPTTYSMHKNPKLFPDPDKFIAERFVNKTQTMQSAASGKIEDRDHFLFGWGRRVCPGIHLAEVQMFNVLTRVFAHCTLKPPVDGTLPDLDDCRSGGITISPPPFKARFVRRQQNST
ncbi:cytochrome P450 [Zychaea mexicana]|uniref:cytochrome P450 n=1 Tax=Zychaea mexicana TaxID=64656 RepID=UPI0022FF272D|nr:cytochrome P450 [Zychaea mexicana]KAI9491276.1 cytochrome P450 [Zychaea mexicana]